MLIKIGNFVLAERKSIVIVDKTIKLNLRDGNGDAACASGSDCNGAVNNREIAITARFIGGIESADILYRALETHLDTICSTNQVLYQYKVRNETTLEYLISSAYIEPQDIKFEWSCPGIKTGIIHLITTEEDATTEIASAGVTVLKPLN